MPLLSIYFLSLPFAEARLIGLYTALGTLAAFLFEIPSGYLSDRLGHKKVLILAKVCMLVSTLAFIVAGNFWWFVVGTVGLSLGFAFSSGSLDALLHETLLVVKKDKQYARVRARMSANASLISAFIILSLPFLSSFNLRVPFIVFLAFDVFGLFVTLSLFAPPQELAVFKSFRSLFHDIKKAPLKGFYPVVFFGAFVSSAFLIISPFKEPFLQELGAPVVLVGVIMGVSRFVWFFFGRNIHLIEKYLAHNRIFIFELFFFPFIFVLASLMHNPFLFAFLLIVAIGYRYGRESYLVHLLIEKISNKRYKATMLSVYGQTEKILDTVLLLPVSFVMGKSFALGFFVVGIFLFTVLFVTYFFFILPTRRE